MEELAFGGVIDLGGQQGRRDALIVMLRETRYPSLGNGSGGGSGNPSVLNEAAIDLYEHIDGYARACLNLWKHDIAGDLEDGLDAFGEVVTKGVLHRMYDAIHAEADSWMTPEDASRMYARFDEWCRKILDLIDPPHTKELEGACPECGKTHDERDGVRNRALVSTIRPGYAPTAECRACGKLWAGKAGVMTLAEAIGASIDHVAIREIDTAARKVHAE